MEINVTTWKLTAAQVQALNSSPFTVVPSAGSNKVIIFDKAYFYYDYGTAAFGGIAAGENLEFKYTDNSGVTAAVCETIGFLDQTNDEDRVVLPNNGTVAIMEQDGAPSVLGEPLVLQLASGDITGGTASTLQVTVFYYIINKI